MPAKIKSLVPLHKRDAKPGRETWGDPFYARKEWRATRLAVLTRDLWTCTYCGCELHGAAATVDHVVARANGGSEYDPANLVACCRRCNSVKGSGDAHRSNVPRLGVQTPPAGDRGGGADTPQMVQSPRPGSLRVPQESRKIQETPRYG